MTNCLRMVDKKVDNLENQSGVNDFSSFKSLLAMSCRCMVFKKRIVYLCLAMWGMVPWRLGSE